MTLTWSSWTRCYFVWTSTCEPINHTYIQTNKHQCSFIVKICMLHFYSGSRISACAQTFIAACRVLLLTWITLYFFNEKDWLQTCLLRIYFANPLLATCSVAVLSWLELDLCIWSDLWLELWLCGISACPSVLDLYIYWPWAVFILSLTCACNDLAL